MFLVCFFFFKCRYSHMKDTTEDDDFLLIRILLLFLLSSLFTNSQGTSSTVYPSHLHSKEKAPPLKYIGKKAA